ncbi:MAG: DUF4266 domain-containing protein [Gammaproteobacteria bacterium]|nr:DUF4266 domain-containing protein [Gammaproteobacteria bacterium]
MNKRKLCSLIVVFISLLSSGCVQVNAWERGVLAKQEMGWDPDPLMKQLNDHVYFSKEGSTGGVSLGGGGCGCN